MNTPIIYFILSSPRSGSTMLRVHLKKPKNCIALPELHFFPFKKEMRKFDISLAKDRVQILYKWTEYFCIKKIPFNSTEHLQFLKQKNIKSWKDLMLATLEFYRLTFHTDLKNPIFIEKSPPHIFFQKEIKRMFPRAKFIYLVRDPRAVIGSLKNMPWSTSNVLTLARAWKISTNMIVDRESSIILKYEEIVENPEKIFQKISKFLGLSEVINFAKKTESEVEKTNSNSTEVFRPINKNNLEKWRDQLSNTDCHVQIIEQVCSEGMDRFQYKKLNLCKTKSYYFNLIASYLHLTLVKLFS